MSIWAEPFDGCSGCAGTAGRAGCGIHGQFTVGRGQSDSWQRKVQAVITAIDRLQHSNETELGIARRAAEDAGRSPDWDEGFYDGWAGALDAIRAALREAEGEGE